MSDFAEKNRQVFDKMASSYKADFADALVTLFRLIQGRRSWASDVWTDTSAGTGKEIKALDYACGPGVVSLALAPFVSKIFGVDISENMVNEYKSNIQEAGHGDKVVARKGDLFAEPVSAEFSGPDYSDFDLVAVSMALHHFEDPGLAMNRLSQRLRKGGVCLIIDIIPEEHHDHGHDHGHGHGHGHHGHGDHGHGEDHEFAASSTIKTHGFSAEQMKKLYEDAGLTVGFDYQVIEEPLVMKKDGKSFVKTIFFARAQRA